MLIFELPLPDLYLVSRIANCPQLTVWYSTSSTSSLLRNKPRLQTVIVSDNALKDLPHMEMVHQRQLLSMEVINFSNNRIRKIAAQQMLNGCFTHDHVVL